MAKTIPELKKSIKNLKIQLDQLLGTLADAQYSHEVDDATLTEIREMLKVADSATRLTEKWLDDGESVTKELHSAERRLNELKAKLESRWRSLKSLS